MDNINENIDPDTEASECEEIINILNSLDRDISLERDSSQETLLTQLEMDFYNSSNDVETESSLLQLARSKPQNIEDICCEFVQLYVSKPEAALLKFMQFVLEASGSDYQLEGDLSAAIKNDIDFNVQVESTMQRSPLIMHSSHFLSVDVISFLNQLLHAVIRMSVVVDSVFLKRLSGFLVVAAESDVLPLRYTSTLFAMKMMTTLSDLMTLQNKKLHMLWMQLFEEVFLNRRLDAIDDIRSVCIVECGIWMNNFPQCYLSSMHLLHLFEALEDSSRKVWEASLRAIMTLQMKPKLRTSCLKLGYNFRISLLNLSMDHDTELAAMAMQLLVSFHRAMPQLLDEDLIEIIEQLIFTRNRGVAQSAAELLHNQFLVPATDSERVLAMVRFYIKVNGQEQGSYLVDSFYGNSRILLDWPTMVKMLLIPDSLTRQEAAALIEIMALGIKQAVTGEIPPGRISNALMKEPLPQATELATANILPVLNMLLQHYSSDDEDVKYLLDMSMYLNYTCAHAQNLIGEIFYLMFNHSNLAVMQKCIEVLENLFLKRPEIADINHKELLERAAINYMRADGAWQAAANKTRRMLLKACANRLLVTLRLVWAIYERFDMEGFHVLDTVQVSLKRAIKEMSDAPVSLSSEAICLCLNICHVGICWDLKRIQEAANVGQPVDDDCLVLAERLDEFFLAALNVIDNSRDLNSCCEAFISTCDLLVLFADNLRYSHSSALHCLEYKVSIYELRTLETFLLRYVFGGSADAELAMAMDGDLSSVMHNKRRILTAFCKLCSNNIVPVLRASIVFQYYEQFNALYGDILFATMERCMSINMIDFGMALMHTCLLVYKRILAIHASTVEAGASIQFDKLLNMAGLFGNLLNINIIKSRPAVVLLHRAGIRYAIDKAPESSMNLLYFKVLRQFVPYLLTDDILAVLKYLDDSISDELHSSSTEDWEPLYTYRDCLVAALNGSIFSSHSSQEF